MNLTQTSKILITCAKGISPFLEEEIKSLGKTPVSSHETGLVLNGTLLDTYKLNLELRTAYNVLFLLKEFNCSGPDELYQKAGGMEWEDIIPPNEYVTVVSQVNTPSIKNSMFANQKLKDALVDRMLKKTGSRPDAGPERGNIVINLYWNKDLVWIYLNTSGRKLADRGYRKIPLKAPMQETLAAAVIRASGYTGKTHFVNPMCGSGTLAIEAALAALNKAPGLLRGNYAFMHLKGFDNECWQALRKEALKRAAKKIDHKIIATDINSNAVHAAASNAKTAGVDHLIEFKTCDYTDTVIPDDNPRNSGKTTVITSPPEADEVISKNTEIASSLPSVAPRNDEKPYCDTPLGKGIVILNPEYGERMGDAAKLAVTYKEIGDFFKKNCTGYTGFIFTGNLDLAKKVGLHASRRIPFYNGDIECRLLRYEIY